MSLFLMVFAAGVGVTKGERGEEAPWNFRNFAAEYATVRVTLHTYSILYPTHCVCIAIGGSATLRGVHVLSVSTSSYQASVSETGVYAPIPMIRLTCMSPCNGNGNGDSLL